MLFTSPTKHTKKLVLTIALSPILLIGNAYAEIYKTVDENGKVTFSDQPHPGAETVNVQPANTTPAVDIPVKSVATQETAEPNEFTGYTTLSITNPSHEDIIPNRLLPLVVNVKISPALQEGHVLQLDVNGEIYRSNNTLFNLPGLDRGQHQLQVTILNTENQVLKQSSPITVFAYQPSSNR